MREIAYAGYKDVKFFATPFVRTKGVVPQKRRAGETFRECSPHTYYSMIFGVSAANKVFYS